MSVSDWLLKCKETFFLKTYNLPVTFLPIEKNIALHKTLNRETRFLNDLKWHVPKGRTKVKHGTVTTCTKSSQPMTRCLMTVWSYNSHRKSALQSIKHVWTSQNIALFPLQVHMDHILGTLWLVAASHRHMSMICDVFASFGHFFG